MCGTHMRRSVHARSAALSIHPVSDVCPSRSFEASRPSRPRWRLSDPALGSSNSRPELSHPALSGSMGWLLNLSRKARIRSLGAFGHEAGKLIRIIEGLLRSTAAAKGSSIDSGPGGIREHDGPAGPPGNQCPRAAPQSWRRAAGPMTAAPTTAACATSVSMSNPPCAEPRRPTRRRRLPGQGRSARPVLE
jgi:hypothetical protein